MLLRGGELRLLTLEVTGASHRCSRATNHVQARPADREVRPHELCNREQGLWVLRGDHKKGASCTGRGATALFPILKRPHGHSEQCGKLGLGQAGAFADSRNRRNVDDAPDLAALELTQAFQEFPPDIAVYRNLSHRSLP